jgi:hypothetical protein
MHIGPDGQLRLKERRVESYLSKSNLFSIPAVFPRLSQPLDHLHGFLDTKEMDEGILLIPNNLDNIDIPKRPHFLRYLILAHLRIDVGDIDRPSSFLSHDCIDDFPVHPWLFACHVDV